MFEVKRMWILGSLLTHNFDEKCLYFSQGLCVVQIKYDILHKSLNKYSRLLAKGNE